MAVGLVSPTGVSTIDDVRVYERAHRSDEILSMHRCMPDAHDLEVPERGAS